MRKGTKTLGKVLLTSALTAAMAVSMGMTAFATDGEFGTDIANVKANNTVTYAANGVTLDNTTYTLTIVGQDTAASVTISDKTGALIGAKEGSPVSIDTAALFTEAEIESIKALGVGTYTFKVTETVATTATNAAISADSTEYYVQVQVKNTGSGKNNNYVVAAVVARKDSDTGTKSDIEFNNTFTKMTDLTVSKAVTGDGATLTDTFTYEIIFTKDDANDGLTLTADKAVVNKSDSTNVNINTALDYDVTYTFTLQNTDDITFTIPAGTTYKVQETEKNGYTATVAVVEDGTSTDAKGTGDTVTNALAGESTNTVTFTNEKTLSPLTGLLTENAPFVAMIAVAGVAFVAYVIYKKRENA